MRNILFEQLPDAVEINGQLYQIDTDFRASLRVILAFEDEELAPLEKQVILIDNLYPEKPDDLEKAFELGVLFLNGGEAGGKDDGPAYRLYSFGKDGPYIFAAFKQTHGIDLDKEQMHWWKFMALFMDLGSETTFCQLVSLRQRVKSGKATKEEYRAAREMGDVFNLPEFDDRTDEEKAQADEFFRQVEEARKRRRENGRQQKG